MLRVTEEDKAELGCSIQLQSDWVRNYSFRARASLRLEQNQADAEDREGRAVGVGRREKIVALCGRRPTCGAVCRPRRSRSRGHRGCRGRTPRRSWSRGRWAPGGARPSGVSSLGCGVASGGRRSAAGETSSGGGRRGELGRGGRGGGRRPVRMDREEEEPPKESEEENKIGF